MGEGAENALWHREPANKLQRLQVCAEAGPGRSSVCPESSEEPWTPACLWDQLGTHSGEGPLA